MQWLLTWVKLILSFIYYPFHNFCTESILSNYCQFPLRSNVEKRQQIKWKACTVLTNTFIAIAQARDCSCHSSGNIQSVRQKQDILIYCHSLDLLIATNECKCWKFDRGFYGIQITNGNVPELSQWSPYPRLFLRCFAENWPQTRPYVTEYCVQRSSKQG